MRYIVYPNQERSGGISLVIPTGEVDIEQVALKDVPAGLPFLYVNAEQLPDDVFFEAWEANFSNPDGYGIGHEAWVLQQEQAQ